jgi:hypothetical protein
MKKSLLIISNAILWAAVILACSIALRGTEAFQAIQSILAGGAVVSMFTLAVSAKQATSKSK